MVAIIKNKEELASALKHDGLVVLDFFAVWCGPCKMISPLLEKFSQENPSARFYKIDVDETPEIAQEYEVASMPTLLFLKNGSQVGKVIGANPAAIKQAITSNL